VHESAIIPSPGGQVQPVVKTGWSRGKGARQRSSVKGSASGAEQAQPLTLALVLALGVIERSPVSCLAVVAVVGGELANSFYELVESGVQSEKQVQQRGYRRRLQNYL